MDSYSNPVLHFVICTEKYKKCLVISDFLLEAENLGETKGAKKTLKIPSNMNCAECKVRFLVDSDQSIRSSTINSELRIKEQTQWRGSRLIQYHAEVWVKEADQGLGLDQPRLISKVFVPILYRSGTVNSNTVNSKFHLMRSFFEIFARFLSFHVFNAQLI